MDLQLRPRDRGRRTAEELRHLKERAVELRLEGLKPKQIARELGLEDSLWRIYKWLQTSDRRILSTREGILALDGQGIKPPEIAKRLKVTQRHVLAILQEERGYVLRKKNTTEQNVDRFLDDPGGCLGERFTRSPAFGWALLQSCLVAVDDKPLESLEVLRPTLRLFDHLRSSTRRKEKGRRLATCMYLQARGLEAHVFMQTGRLATAHQMLEEGLRLAGDCVACEADYLRRFSLVYGYMERWEQAHEAIAAARRCYRALGRDGHDLYGNAQGSCLLARCAIRGNTMGPEAAAADAREGLRITSPKQSPMLYGLLVFNLAVSLKESRRPEEIREARRLLEHCSMVFRLDGPTMPRVYTRWLDGQLAALEGHRDDAETLLTYALSDARRQRLENEVAAITADLGALSPTPALVRSRIDDLCVYRAGRKERVLPRWLDSRLQAAMYEVRRAADQAESLRTSLGAEIFVGLREAAGAGHGGKRLMPSLVL